MHTKYSDDWIQQLEGGAMEVFLVRGAWGRIEEEDGLEEQRESSCGTLGPPTLKGQRGRE